MDLKALHPACVPCPVLDVDFKTSVISAQGSRLDYISKQSCSSSSSKLTVEKRMILKKPREGLGLHTRGCWKPQARIASLSSVSLGSCFPDTRKQGVEARLVLALGAMPLQEHGASLLSERLHPFYTPRVEELYLSFLEKSQHLPSNCFLTLAIWKGLFCSASLVCVCVWPLTLFRAS